MKSIANLVRSFFAFILLIITSLSPLSILLPSTALASAAGPASFQVSVRDHNCSDQDGYSALVGPGGSASATDNNAKDPDCGRILFNPGSVSSTPLNQSIYTEDFRIGTKLAESEGGCTSGQGAVQYTPWASEGGGASGGARALSSVNDPDCLWIYYETRALPAGIIIKDARVGISTGNGVAQYTPWARSGGGWSAFSGGGNISGARVVIDVQFVDIYDGEWISDTIPATMAQAQSGTYNVVMKNKATQWVSDVSPSDNCAAQNPLSSAHSRGDTCSATVTVSSSAIKLKYLNNDPAFTVATNPFPYQRTVTRNYEAIDVCLSGVGSLVKKSHLGFLKYFIKIAEANVRAPIDGDTEPGGGGWTCPQWGLAYVLVNQSPAQNNIGVNNFGTFPMNLTVSNTATPGAHTLNFKLIKDNSELFGTDVSISTTISGVLNTPTGTITATDCTIPSGGTTCNSTVSWTTQNLTANPTAVTANNESRTISTATTGTNISVPINSGQTSFFLYHNSVILAQATVTAVVGMSGTLTSSSPSCIIASGASTCNTNLTWTTTNPEGTSAITSSWPVANTVVATGNSGTVLATIPFSSRRFYLYNNAKSLAPTSESPNGSGLLVISSCIANTTWDGTKCAPNPINGGWGYGPWGECIKGQQTSEPECNNPPPRNGGTCPEDTRPDPVTRPCSSGDGVCSATHYKCLVGTNPSGTTTGGTNVSGVSKWTWVCNALTIDETNASCSELKKKPGYTEN